MKTLRDYITESETWMHTPAEGDSFAIELADGTLIESYIFETADDSILLDATPEIVSVLESWNLLSDQESDDAVILETMGYGTMVGEQELDEINRREFLGALGVGAATTAGLMPTDAEACSLDDIPYINEILDKHKEMMASNPRYEREVRKSIPDVDEWIKKRTRCIGPDASQVEVSKKLRPILEKYGVVIKAKQSSNEGEMDEGIFDRFKKTTKKESYSRQEFYQWLDQVQKQIAQGEDIDEVIYNLESSLEKTYTDDVVEQVKSRIWDSLDLEMDEAKYHGREVPLGKPMAGDVKKSKVYVKDPSTGNIKKVNFGDPNMRIKKSSPGHRKSFRARHHCENPGPRTKARYWSCRAW